MGIEQVVAYFGEDPDGHTWARACIVGADGAEDVELHANVRVDAGRTREAAMTQAQALLRGELQKATIRLGARAEALSRLAREGST